MIYIIHAATDGAIAAVLKAERERLIPDTCIFVASKPGDIPTGADWLREIQTNLATSFAELRAYVAIRQWTLAGEFRDDGVSGAKDRRPAVDRLMTGARRGRVDVGVVWSLDRCGRRRPRSASGIHDFTPVRGNGRLQQPAVWRSCRC